MIVAAVRAERLSAFLNAQHTSIEDLRVVDVFRFCRDLLPLDPASAPAGNLRRAINAHFQELTLTPYLSGDHEWAWRPAHPTKGASPAGAVSALAIITAMFSNRTLARMRQCVVCGAWFFAANAKKAVCTGACRSKKFEQTGGDMFKSKRAKYMRKWRQEQRRRGAKGKKDHS